MSQAIPAQTDQFRGKLARTMLGVVLPISLVPLLILGALAYSRSRQVLLSQINATLISIDEQQQRNISKWIETRQEKVDGFYVNQRYHDAIVEIVKQDDQSSQAYQESRDVILSNLQELNSTAALFNQFFFISPDGIILVASNRNNEGISIEDTNYFDALSKDHNTLALFDPQPIYNSLAIIMARPYIDIEGNHLGTFWAMTGMSRFENIFSEISFLNIRSYVITQNNHYVGVGPNVKELIEGPTIAPSNDMLQRFSAIEADDNPIIEYTSFDGENVLATYRPIPEFEAAVVTEIPTTDIIRQLQNFPIFGVLVAATIIVTAILIWMSMRRFIEPILGVATAAQHFADGDWQHRTPVKRTDEIGLLAYSFNRMADEISSLYRSLESQVISRTQQIRTAAEVAQIASTATDLDNLLKQTVKLIVERFGYYYSGVFLLDDSRQNVILREAYGVSGPIRQDNVRIPVGEGSIVGQVASSNQSYVAADTLEDPYYLAVADLPDTRSEVVIPLSLGDNLFGVLDVQSHRVNAFEQDSIATLQTLANQIASTLQNINLIESARTDLQVTSALYQASHTIAESETSQDVFDALTSTLTQVPFISAIFQVEANNLVGISMIDPIREITTTSLPEIKIASQELHSIFKGDSSLTLGMDKDQDIIPAPLLESLSSWGCQAFTFIPITPDEELAALLILGTVDASRFTRIALEPYYSLIDITRTALEKVNALGTIQQRLVELETISTVGQSISIETNLNTLYEIIHKQIIQVMGDVNFLIALYQPHSGTIEIPYLDEGGQITNIEPFPIGQGLTSIVIKTRQPLMIVEDTVNRSKALGAIVTEGGEAKSWLGVPLLLGGEPLGAIVVQDLENEHRFGDNDMRLLVTLASQVAIAIRNARLLENSRQRSEQDRKLLEITSKIRRSPDMQAILKTTAQQVVEALGAQRAHIEVKIDPNVQISQVTTRQDLDKEVAA